MLALQIEDIKQFMIQLFSEKTFDGFLLYEAKIHMSVSYVIDGSLNLDFFDQDEKELLENRSYARWDEQKQMIFSMIRGKKTPADMQIILMQSPKNVESMIVSHNIAYRPEDVRGLFLNIRYKDGKLICTTGVSLKTFTMDKSLEHLWEEMIMKYFKQKKILSTKIN